MAENVKNGSTYPVLPYCFHYNRPFHGSLFTVHVVLVYKTADYFVALSRIEWHCFSIKPWPCQGPTFLAKAVFFCTTTDPTQAPFIFYAVLFLHNNSSFHLLSYSLQRLTLVSKQYRVNQGFSTGAHGPLRGPRGILRGATSRKIQQT